MVEIIREHYAAPGLLERIGQGLAKAGKDPDNVTIEDLGGVDEFHLGGFAATIGLIERLQVTAEMHVLDVGSGLGGPARRLAKTVGCRVTGIDLSADFCDAGRALNGWTGLGDRVTLCQGDANDLSVLERESFDAAWTLHVGMNIADKDRFYSSIHRALKPGGRFLVYDILAVEGQEVLYPAPWARDPAGSFLSTQAALVDHLRGAGFVVEDVQDRTAAGQALFEEGLRRAAAMPSPPPLGLHVVLGPITKEILPLLKRNMEEGRLGLGALGGASALSARPDWYGGGLHHSVFQH